MYSLSDPITTIKGIGPSSAEYFHAAEIFSVMDLILWTPLRYEDRTKILTIAELLANPPINTFVTIQAKVEKASQFFWGGKDIQTATLNDDSGKKLSAMWFRQKYILQKLHTTQTLLFSGKLTLSKKKVMLTQSTVEEISDAPIHTRRLVPQYSTVSGIAPRKLRSILHHVLENLEPLQDDKVYEVLKEKHPDVILPFSESIQKIHFPDELSDVEKSLRRMAVEELIELIQHSQKIKKQWQSKKDALSIFPKYHEEEFEQFKPKDFPFPLTNSQHKVISEILKDIQDKIPMNRLLLGDVGSGKTIVAGVAMNATCQAGYHACLIAPTQLVAQQHFQSLQKYFPNIPCELITAQTKNKQRIVEQTQPSFFIGTHAILNQIKKQSHIPVGLTVFDEQHRFGVAQRAITESLHPSPHILTMTATPIPRSLMLSIFGHLSLSQLTELPANRIPTITKLVTPNKNAQMWKWIHDQIIKHRSNDSSNFLTLYVCPFIDPSHAQALENVSAATQTYEDLQKNPMLKGIKFGLLHGRQKNIEKQKIITDLYDKKIDFLVTTPIVEVGVDLPQASAMIIENANRFGLASLHQLRGRVGRAGQQGYCILPIKEDLKTHSHDRLSQFCKITDGQKLADLDLQNRGAGNLFGVQQHGEDSLRFANWTDIHAISLAKYFSDSLINDKSYVPLFHTLNRHDQPTSAN